MDFADKVYALVDRKDPQAVKFRGYFMVCKGLAEYRRGNSRQAIHYLKEGSKVLEETNSITHREQGLVFFFTAMAFKDLDDEKAARDAYLEGLDRQQRTRQEYLTSQTSVWANWQLNEVARREAEKKLGFNEADIEPPVRDTSNWIVLLEDNFDSGISDDWQRISGEWSVVDGAACGILEQPDGGFEGYAQLECEIPDLPSTFEIEYEVNTSDCMSSACVLRRPVDSDELIGHRIALTSFPDRMLVNQGSPGTGVNLMTMAPFGNWFSAAVPDFRVEPNRRYSVRIIRQPQRITVFVDGTQTLSERVRNIETRSIRLFARGEEGMKMFVDNIRVKTPPPTPDSEE